MNLPHVPTYRSVITSIALLLSCCAAPKPKTNTSPKAGDNTETNSVVIDLKIMSPEEVAPFFQGAEAYRVEGTADQYYIKLDSFSDDERFLYHPNFWGIAEDFYQLKERGGSMSYSKGGGKSGHEGFDRTGHDSFEISYDAGVFVTCDNGTKKELTPLGSSETSQLLHSAKFYALPKIDVPTYLSQLPDGRYVLVTSPKYAGEDFFEQFRVFIGEPQKMRELNVTKVKYYKDGGTTYVETDEGTFYYPTSRGKPFSGPGFPAFITPLLRETLPMNSLSEGGDIDQNIVDNLKVPLGKYVGDPRRFLCD